jgi:hypothetical protein
MTPDWPPIQVTVSCGMSPSVAHLRRTVCGVLGGLSADKAVLYKYSLQTCAWYELKPGLRVEGAGGGTGAGAGAAGRPVSSVKRIENIFDPPYSLKEGDLLCAFEVPPQSLMLAALQNPPCTAPSASASLQSSSAPICTIDLKTATPFAVSAYTSGIADVASHKAAFGTAPIPTVSAGPLPTVTVIETAVSRPEDKHLRQLRQQEKLNKKAGVTGYRPMRNRKEIVLSIGGDLDFSEDESEAM